MCIQPTKSVEKGFLAVVLILACDPDYTGCMINMVVEDVNSHMAKSISNLLGLVVEVCYIDTRIWVLIIPVSTQSSVQDYKQCLN